MISGCANTPVKADNSVSYKDIKVTGRFFSPMSKGIYLDLHEDGTYRHRFGSRSVSGKYVVKGNHIILTSETGSVSECIIEGNYLLYNDGSRLIRQ